MSRKCAFDMYWCSCRNDADGESPYCKEHQITRPNGKPATHACGVDTQFVCGRPLADGELCECRGGKGDGTGEMREATK